LPDSRWENFFLTYDPLTCPQSPLPTSTRILIPKVRLGLLAGGLASDKPELPAPTSEIKGLGLAIYFSSLAGFGKWKRETTDTSISPTVLTAILSMADSRLVRSGRSMRLKKHRSGFGTMFISFVLEPTNTMKLLSFRLKFYRFPAFLQRCQARV
jgi:hypothetical protein